MKKTVKCPICGNIIETFSEYSKFKCPTCKSNLDAAVLEKISSSEQSEETTEKVKKTRTQLILESLIPNEIKIFIFIILAILSIFIVAIVRYKVVFAILFYPILYWFSCRWEKKPEGELEFRKIIKEFIMLIGAFLIVFFIIPSIFHF
jgi:hypothetical protein